MASNPPLAEVAVDVRANLDQLERDLANGKKQTESWANSVQRSVSGPAKSMQAAVQGVGRAAKATGVEVNRQALANDNLTRAAERYSQKASVRLGQLNAERKAREAAARATDLQSKELLEQERALARTNAAQLKAAGDMGTRVGRSIRSPIVEILGYITAQKLVDIGRDALRNAAALEGLSRQLGISTTDLQVYRYAARQVGIDQNDLELGVRHLTETLGRAATGGREATKTLQLVGFSIKDIRSGALDTGKALPAIADFLAKIPNPAQRAAVELRLFGETGQMLDPLLTQGSAGIDNLRNAAERLGVVLSEREIQEADETARKLDDVKTVLQANVARTVAENADAIVGLASALGQLTGQIIQFMSTNPAEALAILGALLGGRVGGIPGAIIGAGGGFVAGTILSERATRASADQNMDLGFRRRQLNAARQNVRVARGGSRPANDPSVVGSDPTGLFTFRRTQPGERTSLNQRDATVEYNRQITLYNQARQAGQHRGAGTTPALDPALQAQLDALNAPRGRQGPHGPSAATLARQAEAARLREVRDQEAYDRDIARLEQENKDALADLAGTHTDRARLEKERLDAEQADYNRHAESEGPSGTRRYTQVQVETLQAGEARLIAAKKELVDQREQEAVLADRLAINEAIGDREQEMLRAREELTRSAKERRDIELRILEIQKGIEREELENRLAAEHDPIRRRALQSQLAGLGARYEQRTNAVNRSAIDARNGTAPQNSPHYFEDQRAAIERERDERIATVQAAAEAEIELTHASEEARLAILQDSADREVEIRREADRQIMELEIEKRNMLLSNAQSIAESMAEIAGGMVGEQSKVYRALFATAKAFAIAQATIALYENVAKAMAIGFPQNLPFIAGAFAQGAIIVNAVRSVTGGGFMVGGWTGAGQDNEVAGAVHRNEFVFDARATRRVGRQALETIRQGSDPTSALGGRSGPGGLMGALARPLNVQLQNFAPGVQHTVERIDEDRVRIIAREEAPRAVAADLAHPNGPVNKGLRNHTTTRPRTR